MKFVSLAVMALVASLSMEEVSAIDVYKHQGAKHYAKEDSSDSDSSSDSDDDSFVQTRDEKDGEPVTGFYTAQQIGTGPLDKKYERVAPEHFASGEDDLFMRSMIMNYADEGKLCDEEGKNCKPTGVFTLTEAATRAAAAEVLSTHKGLKGAAGKEYLATYFPRTFAHFDVNKEGRVGVEILPQFMRFLASDQTLNI